DPDTLVLAAVVGAADGRTVRVHRAAACAGGVVDAVAVLALADLVRPGVVPSHHALVEVLEREWKRERAAAGPAKRDARLAVYPGEVGERGLVGGRRHVYQHLTLTLYVP